MSGTRGVVAKRLVEDHRSIARAVSSFIPYHFLSPGLTYRSPWNGMRMHGPGQEMSFFFFFFLGSPRPSICWPLRGDWLSVWGEQKEIKKRKNRNRLFLFLVPLHKVIINDRVATAIAALWEKGNKRKKKKELLAITLNIFPHSCGPYK